MSERRVAIVGFASNTLPFLKFSKADEIWSIVWGYNYPSIPRIDRLFEIHAEVLAAGLDPRPAYRKVRDHLAWLKKNQATPVYMQEKVQDIPMSVRYPREDVDLDLFGYDTRIEGSHEGALWTRNGEQQRIYTSTVDYMLALAIHEKFDVIEIYGIELSSESEYAYQREGYAVFHGIALGRRIRIEQPANTWLLYKPRRYGYEGYQMIGRQSLERMHTVREQQERDASARVQYTEGRVGAAQEALEENLAARAEAEGRLRELELKQARWETAVSIYTDSGNSHNAESSQAQLDLIEKQMAAVRQEIEQLEDTQLADRAHRYTMEMMRAKEYQLLVQGAMQNTTHLIREIDLDEEQLTLINPNFEIESEDSEENRRHMVEFETFQPTVSLLPSNGQAEEAEETV